MKKEEDKVLQKKPVRKKAVRNSEHEHRFEKALIMTNVTLSNTSESRIFHGDVCAVCGLIGDIGWKDILHELSLKETNKAAWDEKILAHYYSDTFYSKYAKREEED